MKRQFSCKDCGQTGFKSAWEVRHHKVNKHGAEVKPRKNAAAPAKRAKRTERTPARGRRPARPADVAVPVEPVVDAEATLLSSCLNAFANAQTDQGADARVLAYLGQRFGPEAYAED